MLVEKSTRNGLAQMHLKRRVSRGAMVAALVGTFIVPATSAQAVPCAAVGAQGLSQGDISIEVRRLQTNLMVAALSCHARSDYNEFITMHRPSLQSYGKTIQAEFRRRYGHESSKQLNRFVTRLANEASARSNADRDGFCAEAAGLFAKARTQGITLTSMVTVPAGGTQLASAACDSTTAAAFRPAGRSAASRER
jgi:hypothetical protein